MDYQTLREGFHDVGFTTATPFTDDGGDVNHDALAANLGALIDAGASLFIACGNTGEYHALTHAERVAIVRTHAETVDDAGIIVGGAGGSLREVHQLTEAYESAGAHAVMIMHPRFTFAHERGLLEYYREIADSTSLGVVVYKRGHDLDDAIIEELTTLENVVAIKYAVNDIKSFSAAVEGSPGEVAWLNGIAERFAPAFALEGAVGFTTGIGNFAPLASLALFDALETGDLQRAKDIRNVIRPYENLREAPGVDNTLTAANNVPAVKYGQDLAGLEGGVPRLPLVPLDDADRARADQYFEKIQTLDTA